MSISLTTIRIALAAAVEQSSRAAVARQCGITHGQISRWLSDDPKQRRIPGGETLGKIVDGLGLAVLRKNTS